MIVVVVLMILLYICTIKYSLSFSLSFSSFLSYILSILHILYINFIVNAISLSLSLSLFNSYASSLSLNNTHKIYMTPTKREKEIERVRERTNRIFDIIFCKPSPACYFTLLQFKTQHTKWTQLNHESKNHDFTYIIYYIILCACVHGCLLMAGFTRNRITNTYNRWNHGWIFVWILIYL